MRWPWSRWLERQNGYWEGMASGAAVLTTTYGSPDREAILPSFASFAKDAYGANTIVFGAILARIMLFSEATFTFKNLVNKKLFGSNDPDGLPVLEEPWPNGTSGELLARLIQDADLAGNAYIARGADHLIRLQPDQVTILSEERTDPRTGNTFRVPIGYLWDPNNQGSSTPGPDAQLFDVEDVAHWSPIPDPQATFKGMSWLTPVIREINADQAMTDYKQRYLDNAASPNLLIKYRQKLLSDTIDTIRERMEARYGGASNAFRTLVLDQGADVTVIGNSFEQMQFATVQAAGENRILIASGVPGIVVGSKEGLAAATYSNYAQAMRRFADLTMRPLWRSACGALQKLITVPGPSRLWFDTSEIAALQAGEQERAQVNLTQAQAIGELTRFGYDPDSVVAAVVAGDMSQLTHPGVPVNMPSDVPGADFGKIPMESGGRPPSTAPAGPPGSPAPAGGSVTVAAHTRGRPGVPATNGASSG